MVTLYKYYIHNCGFLETTMRRYAMLKSIFSSFGKCLVSSYSIKTAVERHSAHIL